MTYSASITTLILGQEDSDTAVSETFLIPGGGGSYRLGANRTPPLPANWRIIPNGASPVPKPAAPSAATQVQNSAFGLTTTGVYKWWLSNVTAKGQTPVSTTPLTVTLTGSNNGAQLTLPAATTAAYNPVIARKLYRSTAGGSSAFFVTDLDNVGAGTYTDGLPDSALGDAAPTSDTSGISPSPVSVVGPPGTTTYTERALGSSLTGLDFTCDYSVGPTGGTLTFASADAGKTVTITSTGAMELGRAIHDSLVTAIQDLYTYGTQKGLRQVVTGTQTSTATAITATSATDWPGGPTLAITTATGGSLRARVSLDFASSGGAANQGFPAPLYVSIDGTAHAIIPALLLYNAGGVAAVTYSGVYVGAITAGAHSIKIQAAAPQAGANLLPNGSGYICLEVEEFA